MEVKSSRRIDAGLLKASKGQERAFVDSPLMIFQTFKLDGELSGQSRGEKISHTVNRRSSGIPR